MALQFSYQGEPKAIWYPEEVGEGEDKRGPREVRVVGDLPDDPVGRAINAVEDPARIVGAAHWEPPTAPFPPFKPLSIGEVAYPHAYAAEQAGACMIQWPGVYVSEGVPVGGGWTLAWAWSTQAGWSASEV